MNFASFGEDKTSLACSRTFYFSGVNGLPNVHSSDVTWHIQAGNNAKEGGKAEFKEGRDLQTSPRCPVSGRADGWAHSLFKLLPLNSWQLLCSCLHGFPNVSRQGLFLTAERGITSLLTGSSFLTLLQKTAQLNTWGVLLKSTVLSGKIQNSSQEVNQAKQRNDFFSTTTYKSPCLILSACWTHGKEGVWVLLLLSFKGRLMDRALLLW